MAEMKSRVEMFALYDHTGIKRHLEKMAEKGWKLVDRSALFWRYEKIVPQKLQYMILYSENICTDKGDWKLVVKDEELNIFCSDKENPEPVNVDATDQMNLIHTNMKSRGLLINYLLVMNVLMQIYIYSDELGEVSGRDIYWFAICVLMGVLAFIDICFYFMWYRKAKISTDLNDVLPETKKPILSMKSVCAVLGLMLLGGLAISLTETSGGEIVVVAILLVATAISVFITIKVNKHVKSRIAQILIIGFTWIFSIIAVVVICIFIMMHVLVIKDVYF